MKGCVKFRTRGGHPPEKRGSIGDFVIDEETVREMGKYY